MLRRSVCVVCLRKRIATFLAVEGHIDAAYGAAGGTLGTSAGAFFGLVFILFVFSMFMPKYRKNNKGRAGGARSDTEPEYAAIFSVF